jgi:DNA polymerase I-like protein with 3'-5' exonuclease and polymerase domains
VKLGTIDFETEAITARPAYPPVPVGVALKALGRRAEYLAWGHPTGNNCTRGYAKKRLKAFARDHVLICHHAGFDLDVLETHFRIRWPRAHHDTLVLGFLEDPDSPSLSLKPLAERYLDEPPTERDAVRDYVLNRVKAKDPAFRFPDGPWATAKTFGAFIARCPGDLIGTYAIGDVDRTEKLFRRFQTTVLKDERFARAYAREIALTPVLIAMERRGIPIDVPRLTADIATYTSVKRVIEEKLLRKLRVPAKLRRAVLDDYDNQEEFSWSGAGFARWLLRSKLVESLPQTEKGNDSTSAESLALVMPPKLAKEFEVRSQIATCLNTFMKPWLKQATATGGFFYARFNQVRNGDEWGNKTGARTGRLSMTPNLQNVIRSDKDERVPVLRDYIVPGARYRALAQRDYSQQELRILAHYEDGPFKASYLANPDQDAHELVRGLIRSTTGVDLKRRPVKDLNFGLIYGQGLNLTAEKMGIPKEEAARMRRAHAASLPGIPKLQKRLKERVAANEPIWTWGGRRYYCEKPAFVRGRWRSFEYKMLNKLIQGSAADCTKQAMINYARLPIARKNPMLLQIHDELIVGVTGDPMKVHKAMARAMADVKFDIPMLSDGKLSSESWHRMKKLEVKFH